MQQLQQQQHQQHICSRLQRGKNKRMIMMTRLMMKHNRQVGLIKLALELRVSKFKSPKTRERIAGGKAT